MKSFKTKFYAIIALFGILMTSLPVNAISIPNNDKSTNNEKLLKVENQIFEVQKNIFKNLDNKFLELSKKIDEYTKDKLGDKIEEIKKSKLETIQNTNVSGFINFNKGNYERYNIPADYKINYGINFKGKMYFSPEKGIYSIGSGTYDINDENSKFAGNLTTNTLITKDKIQDKYNYIFNIPKWDTNNKLVYSQKYYDLFGMNETDFEGIKTQVGLFEASLPIDKNIGMFDYNVEEIMNNLNLNLLLRKIINSNDNNDLTTNIKKIKDIEKDIFNFSQTKKIFSIYKEQENKYYFTITPEFINFVKNLDEKYKLGLSKDSNIVNILKEGKITKKQLWFLERKGVNAIKINDKGNIVFIFMEKNETKTKLNVAYVEFGKNNIERGLIASKRFPSNDLALAYLNNNKLGFFFSDHGILGVHKKEKLGGSSCSKYPNTMKIALRINGAFDLETNKFNFFGTMPSYITCEDGKLTKTSYNARFNGELLRFIKGSFYEAENAKQTKDLGKFSITNTKEKIDTILILKNIEPGINELGKNCNINLLTKMAVDKKELSFGGNVIIDAKKCSGIDFKLKASSEIVIKEKDFNIIDEKIKEMKKEKIYSENEIEEYIKKQQQEYLNTIMIEKQKETSKKKQDF